MHMQYLQTTFETLFRLRCLQRPLTMWQRRFQALLHAKIHRSRRETGIGVASPGTRRFNTVPSVEAARKFN